MKKIELQKAYEEQKQETELWKKRFEDAKNDDVSPSDIRRQKNDLSFQKNIYEMNQTYTNIKLQEAVKLKEENKQLKEDIERLLDDTKGVYKPGIVQREKQLKEFLDKQDSWATYKIEKLEKNNAELKRKVEEQTILIDYLKKLISDKIFSEDAAEEEVKKLYEKYQRDKNKPHHAQIDKETEKRILELRERGFSMRYIAKMEQVSVGVVHKIIHKK